MLHLFASVLFLLPFIRLGKEALIAWIVLQPILANLFVLKQMTLFGWTVTCSDVYAVSCALGLNLLQEYYGKETAKRTVWLSFLLLLFFVVMASLHLLYIPSSFDTAHAAYSQILSPAPRLVAASVATFLCVQWLDVQIFGFLGKRLPLYIRNCISLTLSQFVDTLLFTILGLYGLISELFQVFLVSFAVKLTIALLLSLSTIRRKEYAL